MRVAALFYLLTLFVVQAHHIKRYGTQCSDWERVYFAQWRDSPEDCRTGSSAQVCCQLYSSLHEALQFFIADPPHGLGCSVKGDNTDVFKRLVEHFCSRSYAPETSAPQHSSQPGKPTDRPLVRPTPDNGNGRPDNGNGRPDNGNGRPDNGNGRPDNGNGNRHPDNGNRHPDNGNRHPGRSGKKPYPSNKTKHPSRESPKSSQSPIIVRDGSVCFHGSGKVTLRSGRQISLYHLKIGDEVHVGTGQYSKVFMFTHRSTQGATFVNVSAGTSHLVVTPGHYVHTANGIVQAGNLHMGDSLVSEHGTLHRIQTVTLISLTGIYNPQTIHGDIVVNGWKASTYTAHIAPPVAHTALAPMRAMFYMLGLRTTLLECGVPSVTSVLHGVCSR